MLKYHLVLLLLIITTLCATAADDFAVVVHNDNPVKTMKKAEIEKIFLGKKNFWENDHRIEVYLQTENDLHKKFIFSVIRKSPRQFKMYWRRALYSGTGLPPQQYQDDQMIKSEVAANPRAISYINEQNLDGTVKRVQLAD